MHPFSAKPTSSYLYLLVIGTLYGVLGFSPISLYAGTDSTAHHLHHEIMLGERLFYGLAPFASGSHNCAACHYTQTTDTLNWNPSATDLAQQLNGQASDILIQLLAEPASTRMRTAHEGMQATPAEAHALQVFLAETEQLGLRKHKPIPLRLLVFLGTGFLLLLILVDLFFTKLIRYRIIHISILILALAFHLKIVAHEAIDLSRTENYAPDQPIKFSHKIHAGTNQIDCLYCHSSAENSKSATLPANQLCLNCHNVVRTGSHSGAFEINKIHTAQNNQQAIEWIRIHKLPDHAYFSHAQHVNVGKIDCQNCHGPVETQHLMKQEEDLSMGWCINCHRERRVLFDENAYYKNTYKQLYKDFQNGNPDSITAARVGGLDCMKCHY